MTWDYLKSWTNYRRQLSKRHVTTKIDFSKNKEIMRNSPQNCLSVILCYLIGIFWVFKWSMRPLFNQKAYFHFFASILRYQRFMSLQKGLPLFQLFTLCTMFGMHIDNISVLLNSVAAAYIHLTTPCVTITCWYVHTKKLEIHTRLK